MEIAYKLLYLLVCVVIAIGVILGIDWLLWQLWTWVLPQLYPSGPTNLIKPGFWLFVGAFFGLGVLGRTLFGRRK